MLHRSPSSPVSSPATRSRLGRRPARWAAVTVPFALLAVVACGAAEPTNDESTDRREDAVGKAKLKCGSASVEADGVGSGLGAHVSTATVYQNGEDELTARLLQGDVCRTYFSQAIWDYVLDEAEASAIRACEYDAANTILCNETCEGGRPACFPEFRPGGGACSVLHYGSVHEYAVVVARHPAEDPEKTFYEGYCVTDVKVVAGVTDAAVGCGKRDCESCGFLPGEPCGPVYDPPIGTSGSRDSASDPAPSSN